MKNQLDWYTEFLIGKIMINKWRFSKVLIKDRDITTTN